MGTVRAIMICTAVRLSLADGDPALIARAGAKGGIDDPLTGGTFPPAPAANTRIVSFG